MGIGNEGKLGISLTIFQTSPAMFSFSNLTSTALERNTKLDLKIKLLLTFFTMKNTVGFSIKSTCAYDC